MPKHVEQTANNISADYKTPSSLRTHPPSSSNLVTGLSATVVLLIIAMILAAATGVAPYGFALLAIGLSVVIFLLVSLLRTRITAAIVAWLLFSLITVISALRTADLPYAMLATIALGVLLSANFGWESALTKSIAILSTPFALTTILMYLSPSFSERVANLPALTDAFPGDYRSGITTHYTLNGILLALGALCATPYVFRESRRKPLWIGILLVIALGLILTTKRAHIAFAILSLILTYISLGNRGRNRTGRMFNALSGIAVAAVCIIPLATYIPAMGAVVDRFIQATGDESFNGRRAFYDVAISLWRDSPIIGQGWGSFTPAFNMTGAGQSFIARGFESINAHNVFLQLLAETGVVGLTSFLVAAAITLACGIRILRQAKLNSTDLYTNPLQAAVSVQFFFILYCVTGNPLYDLTFYVPYFLSCGVIWSYQIMQQRMPHDEAQRALPVMSTRVDDE